MARAPEHSIVPPTITLTTRNRPELKSDGSDCTNPQQGTVRSRTCMEKLPPSNGLAAARLETPVTVSGESDDQSTAMTKASYDENGDAKPISSSNHHHLVEPRPRLKIPPTLRDSRKLFVGGLPLDGTLLFLSCAYVIVVFVCCKINRSKTLTRNAFSLLSLLFVATQSLRTSF